MIVIVVSVKVMEVWKRLIVEAGSSIACLSD